MEIALFQPDMPTNAAAAIRLAACFGLPVTMIEPMGFIWDDRRLRRVGMDYIDGADIRRSPSWQAFERHRCERGQRLVLLTTRADQPYQEARYQADDILLGGRESAGVPGEVHDAADIRVCLPMAPGFRSLNLVTALTMVLGEALRQTDGFPSHGVERSVSNDE
ncbi:MAG: TrmH family RNA methyltransferase [Pseudomonadota bacterium]